MRQHIETPVNKEKSNMGLKKLLVSIIIFSITMGIFGVRAATTGARNVKISLSSGYDMNIVTTSKKVEEILKEQNITVVEGELVTPELNSEITDNNTIKITKGNIVTKTEELSAEEILESYTNIVEKIITEIEVIPFETITKNVANGSTTVQNKVVQNGVNGSKEIKYKIRYQNGIEVSKEKISEKTVLEPKDKIVEVRAQVTARSSVVRTSASTWTYNQDDLNLLYAVTRQESGAGYEGALAVITCAANRAEKRGSDPLSEYKRKNQFCYTIDNHWRKYLNGNVPEFVKRAVHDALNGKRSHNFYSFRSSSTGISGVNIGGNVYF